MVGSSDVWKYVLQQHIFRRSISIHLIDNLDNIDNLNNIGNLDNYIDNLDIIDNLDNIDIDIHISKLIIKTM